MAREVLTEAVGRVLLVTLNRPKVNNAIDTEMASGIITAIARLEADSGLTAGVITGSGNNFCVGMDLKAFATEGPPQGLDILLKKGCSKPLVAAMEGYAIGGGLELAFLCDILVASQDVKLGLPEVAVGMFAAGGGLFHLSRRLPFGVAMEVAVTGRTLGAEDAYRYGLIRLPCRPGTATTEALDLAQKIAAGAPLAVAATKALIRTAASESEIDYWRVQESFTGVLRSHDAMEGPRAFAEKRAPVWNGR